MAIHLSDLTSRLPWSTPPLPQRWRWARPAGSILVCALFIVVTLQFQRGTMKNLARAERAAAAGIEYEGKGHKGAIGRWRTDLQHFWAGENIFLAPLPPGVPDDRPLSGYPATHPNMPFVVLLLTPFMWMPPAVTALVWNLLKLATLGGIILGAAAVVNHAPARGDELHEGGDDHRLPDWLVLLGVLAAAKFLISDFQHGNTNVFVAGAVVGHLWFYRRGHDGPAGVLLALGICLKLTPALFLLYWLYQRQWRVVAATAAALPVMILMPALFISWPFFVLSITTWWREMIYTGLVEQSWYPIHINQSLPGMIGRYFTSGDSGNYLWDPDHSPVPLESAWITVVDLGAGGARWVLRVFQGGIVFLSAWAVGGRVLARDDGRRMLHYGLIAAMMLLLNQRTWDHHATYIIIAHMPLIYAAAFANLSQRWRRAAGWVLLGSVLWMYLMSGEILKGLFGHDGAATIAAYGIAFWHFLAIWVLCLILTWRLSRQEPPYLPHVAWARRPCPGQLHGRDAHATAVRWPQRLLLHLVRHCFNLVRSAAAREIAAPVPGT